MIGCGDRGRTAHMRGVYKHLAATNFEIVALADPWRIHREQANGMVKDWFGREAKLFTSHRDLLAMDGVDAVMIASPDFHHTTHLEAAAKAGKHIYVEKPLATEMEKLVRSYDAAKAAQAAGSVIQVGTQLRSLPGVAGARELVQTGALGKITRIDEARNGEKPYWYSYIDRDVKEADVDWKEFLGDRKMRTFNRREYAGWYGYYEFSHGPVPQWGAHFLDMLHYITGCGFPHSCVCLGDVTYWKDENKFTTPDNVMATWMYPEGFMVTSSNNFGNGSGSSRKTPPGPDPPENPVSYQQDPIPLKIQFPISNPVSYQQNPVSYQQSSFLSAPISKIQFPISQFPISGPDPPENPVSYQQTKTRTLLIYSETSKRYSSEGKMLKKQIAQSSSLLLQRETNTLALTDTVVLTA